MGTKAKEKIKAIQRYIDAHPTATEAMILNQFELTASKFEQLKISGKIVIPSYKRKILSYQDIPSPTLGFSSRTSKAKKEKDKKEKDEKYFIQGDFLCYDFVKKQTEGYLAMISHADGKVEKTQPYLEAVDSIRKERKSPPLLYWRNIQLKGEGKLIAILKETEGGISFLAEYPNGNFKKIHSSHILDSELDEEATQKDKENQKPPHF